MAKKMCHEAAKFGSHGENGGVSNGFRRFAWDAAYYGGNPTAEPGRPDGVRDAWLAVAIGSEGDAEGRDMSEMASRNPKFIHIVIHKYRKNPWISGLKWRISCG